MRREGEEFVGGPYAILCNVHEGVPLCVSGDGGRLGKGEWEGLGGGTLRETE